MPEHSIKKKLGYAAMTEIDDGDVVGLGTGTTASEFIKVLAESKKQVTCVASSEASLKLANKLHLRTVDLESVPRVDITIDGADQVSYEKQLIKGWGGALLREKILAAASDRVIILIEESKYKKKLGKTKLPIEITPWGYSSTIRHLESAGFPGKMRTKNGEGFYITDNHNYIYDTNLDYFLDEPHEVEKIIKTITGVVEVGIFCHLCNCVLIGKSSGIIERIE